MRSERRLVRDLGLSPSLIPRKRREAGTTCVESARLKNSVHKCACLHIYQKCDVFLKCQRSVFSLKMS